jgi:hypothetical protein
MLAALPAPAGAQAVGSEFQVNTYTPFYQRFPSVAATDISQFVVAWQSNPQDGSGYGVFGQRFDFTDLPTLSISDVTVTEGNLPGRVTGVIAAFTVTLSSVSVQAIAVDYATADGTAAAPSDYNAKAGTLTFNPGQTFRRIAVVVSEDNVHENDETFFVTLSNASNATIADGHGVGTIRNDDQLARTR